MVDTVPMLRELRSYKLLTDGIKVMRPCRSEWRSMPKKIWERHTLLKPLFNAFKFNKSYSGVKLPYEKSKRRTSRFCGFYGQGGASVKKYRKQALSDIAAAMAETERNDDNTDLSAGSLQDIISAALSEPNEKRRKKMLRDFAARRSDVAAFLSENEQLINAEAEAALIGAAVGGTATEKKISYKGGRRHESIIRRKVQPNIAALSLLLKNRMPDKYSDHPVGEIEIEDTSEINEVIDNAAEDTDKENNTV